jgi:hypothetical protein
MMVYMPLLMIENLQDHTRNESETLGGRLNSHFLDSHFLTPKICFFGHLDFDASSEISISYTKSLKSPDSQMVVEKVCDTLGLPEYSN